MRKISVLALLIGLGLSACTPRSNPIPNPIPIVFPDATLTAASGTITIANLESGTLKNPSLYIDGPNLVLLAPEKWGCTPYKKGFGCTKIPDLAVGTSSSLGYTGAVKGGNVAYYIDAQLVVKSLKK